MNMKFINGVTTLEELKAHKVKLLSSPYGSNLHFDLTVKGDCIGVFDDRSILISSLEYALSASLNPFLTMNYAELFDVQTVVMNNISSRDLNVRVFGEVLNQPNARAVVKFQIIDAITDIRKFWDKVLRSYGIEDNLSWSGIKGTLSNIASCIEITGFQQTRLGNIVCLSEAFNSIKNYIETATGLTGTSAAPNVTGTLLRFNKSCSFVLKGDCIITFVLQNPRTGLKNEKEDLVVGLYDGVSRKYYRKVFTL